MFIKYCNEPFSSESEEGFKLTKLQLFLKSSLKPSTKLCSVRIQSEWTLRRKKIFLIFRKTEHFKIPLILAEIMNIPFLPVSILHVSFGSLKL